RTSRIVAIDLSMQALQRARRNREVHGVHFIQADVVRHLPLFLKFDLVICAGVLDYLPESNFFENAVQNINEVLSSGAVVILEVFWESIQGKRRGETIHDRFCNVPGLRLCRLIREAEYGISVFKKEIQ